MIKDAKSQPKTQESDKKQELKQETPHIKKDKNFLNAISKIAKGNSSNK
jgi:hypothetical protein